MVAAAFWARRNKPIWRASADPVGQPAPWPDQNHPEFLNRLFIFTLDSQRNPPQIAAESISIGRQCAYFKGTLRYLFRRLQAEGVNCAMIHGDVPDAERTAELERFREREDVRILLSSEVGSEGIDLQFCRVVVNYDLPWNPMRVEQRIGRIDRVGQTAKRLTIVHFKVADTVEERLYTRLHEKLKVFENSIGDLETILGAEIQRLTLELLSNDLTPEEEEKRIEDTRSAIERRRLQTERLEAEGGSLLAHSDYIADKIGLNRRLGRYVTADELRQYIADFFDRHYQGCVLEWDAPLTGCFRLQLTFAAGDRLTDFI